MTTRRFPKLVPLLCAAALSFGALACGDDDDDDVIADARPTPDADTTDADTTDAAVPDAMPVSTRSGTIAITEMKVTNDLSALGIANLSGAAEGISWTDLTTVKVAPTVGTGQIGECTVFVYDVSGDGPPDTVDEGAISVSGAGAKPDPFPTCEWSATEEEYLCVHRPPGALPEGTIINHTIVAGPSLQTTITIPGETFGPATQTETGMYVSVSGLTNPVNNGEFAIAAVVNATTIAVVDGTAAGCVLLGACCAGDPTCADIDETVGATPGPGYAVIAGAGPSPAGFDFLDDGTADINISKVTGPVMEEFDITTKASGEGLALATSGDQPHALPSTARAVVFDCGDTANGGVCGPSGGALTGIAISGSTTDANLATACGGNPCLPFDMPDPVTQYATFTCSVLGATSATISQEAMTAILGTSPTRIETRVIRGTLTPLANSDGLDTFNIVVGHGLVGFTDL